MKRLTTRALRSSAVLLAALTLTSGPVNAQAPSPYDTTYRVDRDTPVYSNMATSSAVLATIPRGTSGIVLRWCRPEIPFADWQFGGRRTQRAILNERWCEISAGGRVGNVEGRALSVSR